MARMYTRKRGKSGSTRPISKRPPQWCKYAAEEVEDLVVKLARQGLPPSRIGAILRDQYGIPLIKPILGKSMKDTLSAAGFSPNIPEDLQSLIKKAENLKKHLARNKTDYINKRALSLLESKIHNLSKYYRKRGALPEDWKYKAAVAAVT
ncbi:MAG: 30S ribosomal protein S15 [Candidatus Bathyarchaeia archaeon]